MNVGSVIMFIRREPVTISGILVVVLGWLAQLGVNDQVTAGIGTIAGLLIATVVRGGTVSLEKAKESITTAAQDAGQKVAEQITAVDAGAVGEITVAAQDLVDEVALEALGNAGLETKPSKHGKKNLESA